MWIWLVLEAQSATTAATDRLQSCQKSGDKVAMNGIGLGVMYIPSLILKPSICQFVGLFKVMTALCRSCVYGLLSNVLVCSCECDVSVCVCVRWEC